MHGVHSVAGSSPVLLTISQPKQNNQTNNQMSKKKNKKFIVSHTLYISVEIEAKDEYEAEEKFEELCEDAEWYSIEVENAERDTNVNEAN